MYNHQTPHLSSTSSTRFRQTYTPSLNNNCYNNSSNNNSNNIAPSYNNNGNNNLSNTTSKLQNGIITQQQQQQPLKSILVHSNSTPLRINKNTNKFEFYQDSNGNNTSDFTNLFLPTPKIVTFCPKNLDEILNEKDKHIEKENIENYSTNLNNKLINKNNPTNNSSNNNPTNSNDSGSISSNIQKCNELMGSINNHISSVAKIPIKSPFKNNFPPNSEKSKYLQSPGRVKQQQQQKQTQPKLKLQDLQSQAEEDNTITLSTTNNSGGSSNNIYNYNNTTIINTSCGSTTSSPSKTQEFCFNFTNLLQKEVEQQQKEREKVQFEEDQFLQAAEQNEDNFSVFNDNSINNSSKKKVKRVTRFKLPPMKVQSDDEYVQSELEKKRNKLKQFQDGQQQISPPLESQQQQQQQHPPVKKLTINEFSLDPNSKKSRIVQLQDQLLQKKLEEKLEKLKKNTESQLSEKERKSSLSSIFVNINSNNNNVQQLDNQQLINKLNKEEKEERDHEQLEKRLSLHQPPQQSIESQPQPKLRQSMTKRLQQQQQQIREKKDRQEREEKERLQLQQQQQLQIQQQQIQKQQQLEQIQLQKEQEEAERQQLIKIQMEYEYQQRQLEEEQRQLQFIQYQQQQQLQQQLQLEQLEQEQSVKLKPKRKSILLTKSLSSSLYTTADGYSANTISTPKRIVNKKLTIPKSPFFLTNQRSKSSTSILKSIAKEIQSIRKDQNRIISANKVKVNTISPTLKKWGINKNLTRQSPFQFQCDKRYGEIPLAIQKKPLEKKPLDPSSTEYINHLFELNNKKKNSHFNNVNKYNYPDSSNSSPQPLYLQSPYKNLTKSLIQCINQTSLKISPKSSNSNNKNNSNIIKNNNSNNDNLNINNIATTKSISTRQQSNNSRLTKPKEFNFHTTNRVRKTSSPTLSKKPNRFMNSTIKATSKPNIVNKKSVIVVPKQQSNVKSPSSYNPAVVSQDKTALVQSKPAVQFKAAPKQQQSTKAVQDKLTLVQTKPIVQINLGLNEKKIISVPQQSAQVQKPISPQIQYQQQLQLQMQQYHLKQQQQQQYQYQIQQKPNQTPSNYSIQQIKKPQSIQVIHEYQLHNNKSQSTPYQQPLVQTSSFTQPRQQPKSTKTQSLYPILSPLKPYTPYTSQITPVQSQQQYSYFNQNQYNNNNISQQQQQQSQQQSQQQLQQKQQSQSLHKTILKNNIQGHQNTNSSLVYVNAGSSSLKNNFQKYI